jgi:hypothetical protein
MRVTSALSNDFPHFAEPQRIKLVPVNFLNVLLLQVKRRLWAFDIIFGVLW